MGNRRSSAQFLQVISSDVPKDAIELRSLSAKIISIWIREKFEYPNNIIDNFVYIESSIEQIFEDNLHDAVALEKECREGYQFHIEKFMRSIIDLREFLESRELSDVRIR